MLSLFDVAEQLRLNQPVSEEGLRAHQNSTNAVERFLAHSSLAHLAIQGARDHLIDALRAVDYANQHLLQTFVDLSRLLKQTSGVADSAIKYGTAMIARKQWTAAFEALGQAILFDLEHDHELAHDHPLWVEISSAYDLAARTLGRSVHADVRGGGPLRVAVLTSQIVDDSPTERLLSGWIRHANPEMASLRVYSSESGARLRRHGLRIVDQASPSAQTGARILAEFKARRVDTWLASTDSDAVQTSRMLTERIVRDQIELLIVDSTLADGAIGMTIAARPAPTQVVLDRGMPIPLCGVDQVIRVDALLPGLEDPFWKEQGITTRAIFQGVETNVVPPAARRDYGLADDAIVLMTCCSAARPTLTLPFAKMVARLLAENPRAVYLLAGEGDMANFKTVFDAAGVSKRVGFAGRVKDPQAFVTMADLYLAEFPRSSRDSVLNAMSAGKPVMIVAGDLDQAGNAQFVGAPYAVVGSAASLFDRCTAMIRDAQLRASVGVALRRRVEEKFALRQTIDGFMRLVGQELARRPAPGQSVSHRPIRHAA